MKGTRNHYTINIMTDNDEGDKKQMNWMCNVMLMLGIAAVSGAMLWLFWLLSCCVLRRYGNAYLIYTLLKCVMLGYLIPFAVFFKRYGGEANGGGLSYMTDGCMRMRMKMLFGIWCAGLMGTMAGQLFRWQNFQRMLRSKVPVRQREYLLLERMKRQMGIRQTMRMYRSYGLLSPCIYGFLRPKLALPAVPLHKKQLEMILTHELTHLKQGDLFWKPAFALLNSIFWFSPCAWLAAKQVCRWAEASCDEVCCRRYPSRPYFEMISEALIKAGNRPPECISLWSESFREFRWRITCVMRSGRKSRWKKIVTAAVTVLFLAGSSISVYIFWRCAAVCRRF